MTICPRRTRFPELRVFSEAVAIPVNGSISVQVSNVRAHTKEYQS